MKKGLVLIVIIGVLLVGCSQHDTKAATTTIFSTAVSEAIKQPGIVNMTDPQYQFSVGDETYFLWITGDSGTIMNTQETHTIYSLSDRSITEINDFIELGDVEGRLKPLK